MICKILYFGFYLNLRLIHMPDTPVNSVLQTGTEIKFNAADKTGTETGNSTLKQLE